MIEDLSGLLVSEGLRADGVLVEGPAPLGTLWVPLSPGLTVLYGRNGVGKSRLLDAVVSALRGVASRHGTVSLHLTPVDQVNGFDHALLDAFRNVDVSLDDLDFDSPPNLHPPLSDEAADDEGEEALDAAILGAVSRLRAFLRSAAETVGLAEGMCHSPRLALVAAGSQEYPMWRAFVSVVPSHVSEFAQSFTPTTSSRTSPRSHAPFDLNVELPSLDHLRTSTGWRDEPLPVLIANVPFEMPQEFGDGRDSGVGVNNAIACLVATATGDLEDGTVDVLRYDAITSGEGSLIGWADSDTVEPNPITALKMDALSKNATFALRSLTGGTEAVRVELLHPDEWMRGNVVRWLGTDAYGTEVEISALGAGAQRWARLAISLALTNVDASHATVVIVDEPERALHSAAQQQAAEAIFRLIDSAELGTIPVVGGIVATHSAAFLSLPGANLVHVSRGTDNTVALDQIDPTIGVEGLTAQLGITRTDALLTTRWFVFVEGEHDAAVLNALFSDELKKRHAVVRTMSGAANVAAYVNADHLIAYSDAKIRVVLDRVGAASADRWNEAVEAAKNSDHLAARRHLERLANGPGKESKWLYQAGLAALHRGHLDRIELVGLERPDIINYLPVASIVSGATSWKHLADEYFRGQTSAPSFKHWLRSEKGARFDASTLAEIAVTLTDLGDLRKVVEGL